MIGADAYYKRIRQHKEMCDFLLHSPMPTTFNEFESLVMNYMEDKSPRLYNPTLYLFAYPCMIKEDLKLDLMDNNVYCSKICPLMVSNASDICMGGILKHLSHSLQYDRGDMYYEAIEAIRDFKFYSYKTMLNRIKELNRITAFNKKW